MPRSQAAVLAPSPCPLVRAPRSPPSMGSACVPATLTAIQEAASHAASWLLPGTAGCSCSSSEWWPLLLRPNGPSFCLACCGARGPDTGFGSRRGVGCTPSCRAKVSAVPQAVRMASLRQGGAGFCSSLRGFQGLCRLQTLKNTVSEVPVSSKKHAFFYHRK